MTKDKLLTMLRTSDERKHLEEFNLLSVSFSSDATKLAKGLNENSFYRVLSFAKFETQHGGPFYLHLKYFWFDVCELPLESGQMQGRFSLQITTAAEELEQREMIDDILQWMEKGGIEVE
jgi:hypothetical protein